jgi:hypothetical protein
MLKIWLGNKENGKGRVAKKQKQQASKTENVNIRNIKGRDFRSPHNVDLPQRVLFQRLLNSLRTARCNVLINLSEQKVAC